MNKCLSLLVVGDFNVWVDDSNNSDAQQLLHLMNSYGLIQNIKEPTQREGHTLNHVYSNPYQLESHHSVVTDIQGFTTDHYPILMQIPTSRVENLIKTIYCRKVKDIDLAGFREDLKNAIDAVQTEQNFAGHNTHFDQLAREVVDKHAPLVKWTRKTGSPEWLDSEYRKNRALRRK